MTVSQTSFRQAVLDPSQAVPDGLIDGADGPAGRRFSVYRNNVVVSLTEALRTAFPLVHKLLGGATFGQLAAIFVRAHPPASPMMMHYGAALPDFLAGFAPLAQIGYLADCARLDLALRSSYHASDCAPLSAEKLQCDPEDLMQLQLALAPATQIIRSSWPLYDIWKMNTVEGAPKPRAVAQNVLITRPNFDPTPHLLPPGGATWLEQLHKGYPLGEATETAQMATPDFDLTQTLSVALHTGALTDHHTKDH
ncbi:MULTISPECIES: DNA-binding domain-containing protein [Rhodobacterales]|uniref:DNA-binding domain-containing protein n=1 Tax=Rhodobacterales TaxID=204455 RepID=UPI003297F411